MKRILCFLLSSFFILLAACAPKPSGPQTLTVMTHDSFAATDTVIKAFEQANNAKVSFIKSGDAGAALNKAYFPRMHAGRRILCVDNTFLARALASDIYEPYDSPVLKDIPLNSNLIRRIRPYRWITGMCALITIKPISPLITWPFPKP